MSHHLIELSFGPVQSFIASARRSRDLWAGSRLLSEVVRAAAQAVEAGGGVLIYPTPAAVADRTGSNLSNVLLASLPSADAHTAAALAASARLAGCERLRALAEIERVEWKRVAPGLRDHLWQQQVEGLLDCYAAWSAWDGSDAGYKASYDALKTAFARRKNTRDFTPAAVLANADAGLPKSSLDGANESVLPKDRPRAMLRRMGINEGEQLDAIGCIKRSFGRQEDFTALTRLAADAWLRRLSHEQHAALRTAYEPLVGHGLATRCNGNAGAYVDFPYDGGLLFGESLASALNSADDEERTALLGLDRVLRSVRSKPSPYVALMSADGDRMGVFVDRARNPRDHAEVSEAIADFADQVPAIAREHRGHVIFNGGEDLMVAFPLDTVIVGARALSAAFDAAVAPMVGRLINAEARAQEGVPTLRAGVAICHVGEPMGYIRECAEAAEKFAKGEAGRAGQGNALGLKLHARGGHEIGLRLPFGEAGGFAALQSWMSSFRDGQLSSRVAYDIRGAELHRERLASGQPDPTTLAQLDTIIDAEFERVMQRSRQGGGREDMPETLRDALRQRKAEVTTCRALGDELVLARWLSATTERELGESEGT